MQVLGKRIAEFDYLHETGICSYGVGWWEVYINGNKKVSIYVIHDKINIYYT